MKLKCAQHNRRVVFINGGVTHRAGSGDKCVSDHFIVGDRRMSYLEIISYFDDRASHMRQRLAYDVAP